MRQWALKLGKEWFSGNLSVLTQRSKPCSVCSAFCGSGCTLGPDMQPRHLWLRVEQLPHQPVMHRTPRHTKPCTCWFGKTSSCHSCAVSRLVLHNEYAQSELTKQYTEVKDEISVRGSVYWLLTLCSVNTKLLFSTTKHLTSRLKSQEQRSVTHTKQILLGKCKHLLKRCKHGECNKKPTRLLMGFWRVIILYM